jgi:hypothetical protein
MSVKEVTSDPTSEKFIFSSGDPYISLQEYRSIKFATEGIAYIDSPEIIASMKAEIPPPSLQALPHYVDAQVELNIQVDNNILKAKYKNKLSYQMTQIAKIDPDCDKGYALIVRVLHPDIRTPAVTHANANNVMGYERYQRLINYLADTYGPKTTVDSNVLIGVLESAISDLRGGNYRHLFNLIDQTHGQLGTIKKKNVDGSDILMLNPLAGGAPIPATYAFTTDQLRAYALKILCPAPVMGQPDNHPLRALETSIKSRINSYTYETIKAEVLELIKDQSVKLSTIPPL